MQRYGDLRAMKFGQKMSGHLEISSCSSTHSAAANQLTHGRDRDLAFVSSSHPHNASSGQHLGASQLLVKAVSIQSKLDPTTSSSYTDRKASCQLTSNDGHSFQSDRSKVSKSIQDASRGSAKTAVEIVETKAENQARQDPHHLTRHHFAMNLPSNGNSFAQGQSHGLVNGHDHHQVNGVADSSHDEMVPFDATEHPHRRYNPLTRSWVLCSPHRTKRPWQGQEEKPQGTSLPAYDPKCYLCPGNKRATGGQNENYTSTFFFENDYAALMPQAVAAESNQHPLLQSQPARGRCYVICFNPQHNLTLAQLSTPPFSPDQHIVPIIQSWQKIYKQIPAENPFVKYIQIFENKGSAMGCSNPHPHGQVWSLDYIPEEPSKELASLRDWSNDPVNQREEINLGALDEQGRPSMLLTLAKLELTTPGQPRVIKSNEHFVAVVPYWAVWPFEVLLLPAQRQIRNILEMTEVEVVSLARILAEITCKLDNVFKCSFPYSMGIHQQPTQVSTQEEDGYAQFHVHFYPPLLRSASVRKFLVGFEMMAEPQRDLTAEQAAKRIRECEDTHYLATMGKE